MNWQQYAIAQFLSFQQFNARSAIQRFNDLLAGFP
jgi:hypothetical protein